MKMIAYLNPTALKEFLHAWNRSHISNFAEIRITPNKVPSSHRWVAIIPADSNRAQQDLKAAFITELHEWAGEFKVSLSEFTPPMMQEFAVQ